MTSVTIPTPPAGRPLLRFLRTPKGLTLGIFIGLVAIASSKLGGGVIMSRVLVAGATAAAIDMAITYARRREWILPDGAVLTGMIVAFILRPQESWLVLIGIVSVAIVSKQALRTHWSNVLNPAALALVVAAIFLHTGQSWWGALPDLGIAGAVVLLVAGAFIANRINKLPMILAFFGVYFTLLTFASFFRSATVAETFVTPDLQAVLFFAFFMLDDPPTSPVRHEDQIVFGIIVAVVAYFLFMQFGAIYFLPGGLLAGNLWESGRRLVVARNRRTGTAAAEVHGLRGIRVFGGIGAAAVAVPLIFASSIFATSGPSLAQSTTNAHPFVPSFQSDFNGTYTETNNETSGHLVLDGQAKGDLSVGVHIELLQQAVVPPPDDESVEITPDDEDVEAQPVVTTTVNSAQLLDPDSRGLLCDGKLTSLRAGSLRFRCNGTAAYTGVQMQIASQVDAAADGTFGGALGGTMQRTN